MKVFISSTVRGLEQFRDAAAKAVKLLRQDVVRAEDFSASPDSPQHVCLAGVRAADVTILILGGRYGDPQGSQGLSPTHEEYREAREHGGVLVFIQEGVSREPRQEEFVREAQAWSHGQFTAGFSDAEGLKDAVTTGLHEFELSRKAGVIDERELLARARGLLPELRGRSSSSLITAFAGGPRQQVLRPGQLEAKDLARSIQQEALFGKWPVLDSEEGTQVAITGGHLVLEQEAASVLLTSTGDVRIIQGVDRGGDGSSYLPVLIEEDVQEALERGVRFAAWLLDHVDPKRRLNAVAIITSLNDAGYLGWMTRKERAGNRNSVTMGVRGDRPVVVELTPPVRPRASLAPSAKEIAEDLTVLWRRELKA